MAFELRHDEPIPQGIRRVVLARIENALEALAGDGSVVSDSAVHDARKRFREIRGILRLVRDELGRDVFRRENRTFREAARPLSTVRDARILVDSLDRLIEQFEGRVEPERLAQLRRALLERRRAIRRQVFSRDRVVPDITRRVEAAMKRVERWPIHSRGWKTIGSGLRKVYSQGRRALKVVRAGISDEALHEWRKRTKDLRYELELLQSMCPGTVKPLAEQAHRLTDLLGDDHDLAVLSTIAREASAGDSEVEYALLMALVAERRAALQQEATAVGDKLYEARPREFERRLKSYWKIARQDAQSDGTA